MKEAETEVVAATGAGMAEGVGMATGVAVDTTDVKDIIPHPVEEDTTTSLPTKEWEVATGNIYILNLLSMKHLKLLKLEIYLPQWDPSLEGFLQTAGFCYKILSRVYICQKEV